MVYYNLPLQWLYNDKAWGEIGIWKLQRFAEIQWIPTWLLFEVIVSCIYSCRLLSRNASRIMAWGLYLMRADSHQENIFFSYKCMLSNMWQYCFLYKALDCWKLFLCCWCGLHLMTFRLGNVDLCCQLWPRLKHTRTIWLSLRTTVARGCCIGSIVFGSQKFISSFLSLTLSVKVLIAYTPEA